MLFNRNEKNELEALESILDLTSSHRVPLVDWDIHVWLDDKVKSQSSWILAKFFLVFYIDQDKVVVHKNKKRWCK